MGLSKTDKQERLNFVRFWANYVKTHNNKVWSKQQNVLINSVMKSVDKDPKNYMKLKATIARIKSA
jgi:hypothetical protein